MGLLNPTWKIEVGDCRRLLAGMDEASVQTVVTSPPFFGLRDYGTGEWVGGDPDCDHVKGEMRRGLGLAGSAAPTRGGGHKIAEVEDVMYGARCGKCGAERVDEQIGLEESPEEYVAELVTAFREVRRVLRDDGTVWLNLGDSYASHDPGGYREGEFLNPDGRAPVKGQARNRAGNYRSGGLKPKDLIGIPWRVAFALQADGWYLRSEIIWAKPNPTPESVTDRPTKAHEQVFLLTKSGRYFYDTDAIREPSITLDPESPSYRAYLEGDGGERETFDGKHEGRSFRQVPKYRNKRSVWEIATVPYKGAHFATFPPKLVEPCIKAGTPEGGSCGDCGTPWQRITLRERTLDGEVDVDGGWDQDEAGRIGAAGVGHWRYATTSDTLGWRPGCVCGAPPGLGLQPDDLDLIASPTGDGGTDDPSQEVGRAGYSRPRGAKSGRATITRYQQRGYARQLKAWDKDGDEWRNLGFTDEAWAHYIRTDASGGRPLPAAVLRRLLIERRLQPVDPPEWEPVPTRPSTVLDPFAGAGTTCLVALRLERSFIGVELSPVYAEQARERIRQDAPMFNVPAEAVAAA